MKEQKIDKNLNWRLLKKLYSIHSPSGKEDRMIAFLTKYIKSLPGDIKLCKDAFGNLYAVKGESETYPCLVSHIDQVQKEHSRDFMAVETKDIIFGYSPKNHSFQGLGSDDKNGVLICLEALRIYDNVKSVFFKEEETGCNGSSHAEMPFFDDCRWVIQCDRRGNSDLVTTIGFNDLCSEKFIQDIEPEKYGYQISDGLITDVGQLKEKGLKVACVNLSCGYYNPHTDEEITVKRDLMKCWILVRHILEDLTDVYPHESLYRDEFGYRLYDWEIEDEIYSILQQEPQLTAADLYDLYHQYLPGSDLSDFERIRHDWQIMMWNNDDYFETINQEENGKETIETQKPRRAQKKSPF